ncbi:lysophospholipid acyltransferase family protein [Myxococcota bacterium]|nr:lysophospholipid acyltransferase family protein [Myxococcota bacterium]
MDPSLPPAPESPTAAADTTVRSESAARTARKVMDHRAMASRGAEERAAGQRELPPPRQMLKDAASYALMRVMKTAIPYVPPTARDGLGAALGEVSLRVLGREAGVMRDELRRSYGGDPLPEPADRIVARAFKNFWLGDLETNLYPHLGPQNIDGYIDLEGRDRLDAALARGRGAIVLIGHFGMNQLTMAALGHRGYPMNQLSASPLAWAEILGARTPPLQEAKWRLIWDLEQKLPARHISVFGFMRPAFECLERGEVLCLAIDGGGGNRWTRVQFLGRACNVAATPMSLAAKTGAPVLPAFVHRLPRGRHRMAIAPEMPMDRTRDREADLQRNTQRYMGILEEQVRLHPDHYVYFLRHRRRSRGTDGMPFFDDYPTEGP